ncbi:MAG TPA: hypothetical protein VG755_11650 [Nannocystaceae bacterium]|nr:hypothetical protein [Nannocystaceae bacterium]
MAMVPIWFLLALGVARWQAPAAEAPSAAPFELRWDAPSECPDATAVRGAVERRLGRAITGELGAGLVIDVRAKQQDDGRWHVALGMHGEAGEAQRELSDASDCNAAVEAAALVIAIAIDPELASGVPDVPPEPETKPGEEVAGEQTDPTKPDTTESAPITGTPIVSDDTPRPPTRPRAWTRGAIGATAAVSVGDMPIVGGHGRAFAALLRPRFRVEIGGSFGGSARIDVDENASMALRRWTIDARGCAVIAPRTWLEVLPCIGVEAGRTQVDIRGLVGEQRTRNPWVAAIAAPTLAFVPMRWLAIRLALELRVPLRDRDRYQFERPPTGTRPQTVYTTSPVTGALVAGIELRFP